MAALTEGWQYVSAGAQELVARGLHKLAALLIAYVGLTQTKVGAFLIALFLAMLADQLRWHLWHALSHAVEAAARLLAWLLRVVARLAGIAVVAYTLYPPVARLVDLALAAGTAMEPSVPPPPPSLHSNE